MHSSYKLDLAVWGMNLTTALCCARLSVDLKSLEKLATPQKCRVRHTGSSLFQWSCCAFFFYISIQSRLKLCSLVFLGLRCRDFKWKDTQWALINMGPLNCQHICVMKCMSERGLVYVWLLYSYKRGSRKCLINPPCLSIKPQLTEHITRTRAADGECSHHVCCRCNRRVMRFVYLPWFVLCGHTWAEDIDEVTPGPCLAWPGASLCRLADSCLCWVLSCEKARVTWQPGSECWPYALMVNTSQMPNKQKQNK